MHVLEETLVFVKDIDGIYHLQMFYLLLRFTDIQNVEQSPK